MVRLTKKERNEDGSGISKLDMTTVDDSLTKAGRDILTKLATYEDLEEQGLLVRLPCMEGMNLYQLCKDHIITSMVIKFIVVDGNCRIGIVDENGYERSYSEKDIGKSVFLTREEAEKKLEEMKNDD